MDHYITEIEKECENKERAYFYAFNTLLREGWLSAESM